MLHTYLSIYLYIYIYIHKSLWPNSYQLVRPCSADCWDSVPPPWIQSCLVSPLGLRCPWLLGLISSSLQSSTVALVSLLLSGLSWPARFGSRRARSLAMIWSRFLMSLCALALLMNLHCFQNMAWIISSRWSPMTCVVAWVDLRWALALWALKRWLFLIAMHLPVKLWETISVHPWFREVFVTWRVLSNFMHWRLMLSSKLLVAIPPSHSPDKETCKD